MKSIERELKTLNKTASWPLKNKTYFMFDFNKHRV